MPDNIKNIKRKHSNRKLILTFFLGLGVIAIIIGAYLIANNYYKSLNILTYKNYKLFQYVDGQKFEYEGEFYLTRENEITSLETKDITIESNTFPIYYKDDENLVLFPIDMGLVLMDDLYKSYKINHFSQIKFIPDRGNAKVIFKDNEKDLGESFAYDGENLYFFIYPTKLTINDKEYELSSGSYAIVNYKGRVDVYDRSKDEYLIIEETTKDVIGELSDYKINLSTDMIITEKGNRLLIKNNKNLPVYTK